MFNYDLVTMQERHELEQDIVFERHQDRIHPSQLVTSLRKQMENKRKYAYAVLKRKKEL